MSDYSGIPSDRLAKMIELIEGNGQRFGGTMYMSVKAAAEVLRERGHDDDAAELERQAEPVDIVQIKGGRMELVSLDEVP